MARLRLEGTLSRPMQFGRARATVLSVLQPENGGERKFNVLAGIVGGEKVLRPVLADLQAHGKIAFRACHGGGRWGLVK